MSSTHTGYLMIADITGYTAYLSGSELDHAQDTLTTLIELLIEHTRPPLAISRLEGDAVISYALAENFTQGQTFIETIEDTYVAFRRSIELMVLNNTCRCNACANVSALDLKFFVHYGKFGLQRLGGHNELVGSDVNLVHRLLKNSVRQQTGIRAYTLYTEAAVRAMQLEQITASMVPHRESVEHLGDIRAWIQDMHPIWRQKRDQSRIVIPPDQVVMHVQTEVGLPPNLVWDYLVQPEYRKTLIGSDDQRILNRADGRVARGSAYQCFHGKRIVVQTILEWRPFELMTTEDLVILGTTVLAEYRLEPSEGGTRLHQRWSKARGPLLPRLVTTLFLRQAGRAAQRDLDAFRDRIVADSASRRTGSGEPARLELERIQEAVQASLAQS